MIDKYSLNLLRLKLNVLKIKIIKKRNKIFIILSFTNVILNIVELTTILSILVFIIIIFMIIFEKIKIIKKNGLIKYLPLKMQETIFERSFFDILCDIWFIPKISLYFRVLILPFILKPKPEEAYKILDILPENQRNFFLRKGLIYSLPENIQNILLPMNFNIHKKVKNNIYNFSINKIKNINNNSSFFNLDYIIETIKNRKSKNKKFKFNNLNSKVLVTSKMLEKYSHLPGKIEEKWDRLYEYQNNKKNNKLKPKNNINEMEKIGPIKIILKIIEIKKLKFLKKITKIQFIYLTSLGIFSIFLKIKYFKKFRNMYTNLFIKFLFTFGTSFTFISLFGLYLKIKSENNIKKIRKK